MLCSAAGRVVRLLDRGSVRRVTLCFDEGLLELRGGEPARARFCLSCGTSLAARVEARKTVTILFADLCGSTALGEEIDPAAARAILGRYFRPARQALEGHGGTVEKFIGDAMVAVFGITVLREDDAERAVRAAFDVHAAVAALDREVRLAGGQQLQVRVGLQTGEVVAGDTARGELFATGDPVNRGRARAQ